MFKFSIKRESFTPSPLGLKLRANGRNNDSLHCWANNVGSCCVCVGSGVQTDATIVNIVGPPTLGVVESVARSSTFDRFQTLHNNSQQHVTE